MRLHLLSGIVTLGLVAAVGCKGGEVEDEEASEGALRSDATGDNLTGSPAASLLAGYNGFLDNAMPTPCLTVSGPLALEPKEVPLKVAGNLRGEFYMKHVSSREELAKELDVDVGAAAKLPRGSLETTMKVVNGFQQNKATATFVVRAYRAYSVDGIAQGAKAGNIALTPEARQMLADGQIDRFRNICGGAFISNVRYEAQVLAIFQFETKSEKTVERIATKFTGGMDGVLKNIASIEANVGTNSQEEASQFEAHVTAKVAAIGFLAGDGTTVKDVDPTHALEKINELRAEMNKSFLADFARDKEAYFRPNAERHVRPAVVTKASYNALLDHPELDYTRLTVPLQRAEQFLNEVGGLQVRLESVHADELQPYFKNDWRWGSEQFRFNILKNPQALTEKVTEEAQKYEAWFRPNDESEHNLVKPLRHAIENCVHGASVGDYDACMIDDHLRQDMKRAEDTLMAYADRSRIVHVLAWAPWLNDGSGYNTAITECNKIDMRLPKADELDMIRPAITRVTATGQTWVQGPMTIDGKKCSYPLYDGGTIRCGASWGWDWVPEVNDYPVVCVNLNGPAPALPLPVAPALPKK